MEATIKRRNIRRALVVALVGVVSWKIFYPVVTQPLQAKREAIANESRGLEALQNQLGLYSNYLQQVRATGKSCLPSDSMTAAIRYQEWVRDTCEKTGIADPNITIKEPVPEESVGAKVQVTMRSTASLEAVGNLIDTLSTAKIAHRIVRIELKDWDAVGNTIGVNLELDALSLKDNPTPNQDLLKQPLAARGMGNLIDERKSFSRYVPPKPIPIEPENSDSIAVSTGPTRQPSPDLLDGYVLVGILQRNGSPRALFRDNLANTDHVFELNQELKIGDFRTTVVRIEGNGIWLLQEENLIQVALGKSIRQGVELSSGVNSIY